MESCSIYLGVGLESDDLHRFFYKSHDEVKFWMRSSLSLPAGLMVKILETEIPTAR